MNTTIIGTGKVMEALFLDTNYDLNALEPIMEAKGIDIDDINFLYRMATKFNKYSQDDIGDIYNILLDEDEQRIRIRVEHAI